MQSLAQFPSNITLFVINFIFLLEGHNIRTIMHYAISVTTGTIKLIRSDFADYWERFFSNKK